MAVQSAVVTGGGSGVGAALALALARAGVKVTITGRRTAPLQSLAAQHDNIDFCTADVTNLADMQAAFAQHSKAHGTLDLVVANAGAAHSAPFHKTTPEAWAQMISVNLTGVFTTFQAGLGAMDRQASGRLVAIASTAGLKGYPYVSAYCAAKHGTIGLVRSLALELAKTPITVNALCPGFTDTPLLESSIRTIMDKTGLDAGAARAELVKSNPQGRLIAPEEVTDALLWLCGTGAASITGQAIAIAGGEV